ncbi:MAG: sigma 54-interacting transcriptional regulator [Bacillota bacterium]
MLPRELMTPINPQCLLNPESTIMESVEKLQKHRFDALPVVDRKGSLIGIFSKRSLYKCLLKGVGPGEKIKGHYINQVVSIKHDQKLNEISEIRNTPVGQWVVVDDGNRPVGMLTKINIVFFLLNNTERLMNELSAILKAIPIGVIAIDNRGTVSLINHVAEELLGRPADQIEGRLLNNVMQDFDLEKVLVGGKIQLREKRRLDNRTVIFSGHPVKLDGQIGGAIGIFQDLTDLENLSQELESVRRLKQTLETIIASVDNGIVVTDEKGVIVRVNQAALVLLQKNGDKVIGRQFREVFGSQVVDMVLHRGTSEVDVGNANGQRFLMTSNPVMESNAVVGTVNNLIFKNLNKLKNLISRLDLLENQLKHYKKELLRVTASRYSFDSILTQSKAVIQLKQHAMAAASGFSNILILGESGTGKELFAQAIHGASPRRMFPFVKVNCAAIPESLLESELFGYEDGAFTGAKKGGKPGKFELAQGGTIFLDEIGDMPLPLQAKILRVLQEKEFERVGGTETIQVDVRIIAATNMNLTEMISRNRFRQDLYYRLNVISLCIPPLRERREDIILIAEHFVQRFNQNLGTRVKGFTIEARLILENHDWPGNVRELANVVERAMNMGPRDLIGQEHLPPYLVEKLPQRGGVSCGFAGGRVTDYRRAMEGFERSLLVSALRETGGNCTEAARLLGISRSRFYEKISGYSIKNTAQKSSKKGSG